MTGHIAVIINRFLLHFTYEFRVFCSSEAAFIGHDLTITVRRNGLKSDGRQKQPKIYLLSKKNDARTCVTVVHIPFDLRNLKTQKC